VDWHWEGEGWSASCAFCGLLIPLFKIKIGRLRARKGKSDSVGGGLAPALDQIARKL